MHVFVKVLDDIRGEKGACQPEDQERWLWRDQYTYSRCGYCLGDHCLKRRNTLHMRRKGADVASKVRNGRRCGLQPSASGPRHARYGQRIAPSKMTRGMVWSRARESYDISVTCMEFIAGFGSES